MHSIRKWFSRPKREDSSLLAQFYWADEELNMVAAELDSFDGRKDPERCSALVNQLRISQDRVLELCNKVMDDAIFPVRANRDFRVKFPDDILQENLAGQLWFGAECLAAGSNIMNRELESTSMRPLAKALTRALDNVRFLLREQCLRNSGEYSEKVKEGLLIFDRLFAEFELCYVSAMVPVKSAREYHLQQEVIVLFSETLFRALKLGLVTQEMVDDYDPSLMFTIPRLAIVCGLLVFSDGPLNVNQKPSEMSELFRPFYSLLCKIRDLLWTLTNEELHILEKTLCSLEEPEVALNNYQKEMYPKDVQYDYVNFFYKSHHNCKQFIQDFYTYNFGIIKPQEAFYNCATKATPEDTVSEDNTRSGKGSKCARELSHSLPAHGSPAKASPLHNVNKAEASLCSSNCSLSSCDWDVLSCQSTETSSYTSECQDDEEIALALQAAEIATCNKARSRFKNSTDLIHRLFVCVSGVADQLQTNYASDLRNILKCVFEMASSNLQQDRSPFELSTPESDSEQESLQDQENVDVAEEAVDATSDSEQRIDFEEPPEWIPDELADQCMACKTGFTILRRRHHCRNCGKIFCARCSSNSIPLPKYGHLKAVRVCNTCFVQQVTEVLVRQQC